MKKEKNIFCVVIIICFLALILWLFLGWLVWDIQKEKVTTTGIHFTISSLKSLRNFLSNSQSQIEMIENQFVDKEMTVEFIEKIESAARQAGIVLKITSAQDIPDVIISYTSEGHFRSLMQFQILVENLPYKLFFNKFSFYKKEVVANDELWLIESIVKLESVK
ncbi:MAG: hypothetical protein WCX70_00515 [Candidatus Paceibacterota bacterium]|jgi:hypothetical protein